jgi:hypothetical protein
MWLAFCFLPASRDMIRIQSYLSLLLVLCAGCSHSFPQPPLNNLPSAQQTYSDALAKAHGNQKPVVVFFTQDEFWCHRMEGYHADEDVAQLLAKYFNLISIWLDATPGGEQLYYERGGDRGVPAYSIVDPHGELLADSGDTRQHNIGFPNTDDEVIRYLEILKIACPEMTEVEQALLRSKLEARRVSDITRN